MAEKGNISELEKKLNEDLETFISSLEKKPYKEGWSEDNWENEMQQHPLFTTKNPETASEMSPLMEALQQLKYDPAENTTEELANNYKDDGNENFRLKKYRWAIDSYSTGLKQNCKNGDVNAVLLTNRAAAHFRIGNYRSALRDVTEAKKHKPNHMKALIKGAQCCKELEKFADCITWCEEILKLETENTVAIELKTEALALQKVLERDQRKWLIEDEKNRNRDGALKIALRKRNIRFYVKNKDDLDDLDESELLNSIHPAASNYKVFLNEQDQLVWPVIFVYPEHGQTDFIQCFIEDISFIDQLKLMFTDSETLEWDKEKKYSATNLELYFEDVETKEFINIPSCRTLKETLSHERFQIAGGNPTLLFIPKKSAFLEKFIKQHRIVKG